MFNIIKEQILLFFQIENLLLLLNINFQKNGILKVSLRIFRVNDKSLKIDFSVFDK